MRNILLHDAIYAEKQVESAVKPSEEVVRRMLLLTTFSGETAPAATPITTPATIKIPEKIRGLFFIKHVIQYLVV